MSEETFNDPEERLKLFTERIMTSIIKSDTDSLMRRQDVFSSYKPAVFNDEAFVLYSVLYNFRGKKITPDAEFLRMYLLRNENLVLNSSDNLNPHAFDDLDENPVVGYTSAVVNYYNRLIQLEPEPTATFPLLLEKFNLEYQCMKAGDAFGKAKMVLYDGMDVGRYHKQGYTDAVSMLKSDLADIESLIDPSQGTGYVTSRELGMAEKKSKKPELIGDFGRLKELNKIMGGVYTGVFLSILAPTKTGKSKLCSRLCHNIVVEHGFNVVVYPVEGGADMWNAQQRAIHYDYFWNKDLADRTKFKTGVDQKVVLDDDFVTEEQRNLENSSRLDLFCNESYGEITYIDRPFKVETLIEEIDTAVKLSNAKAVIIDYPQLIGWDSKNMSKPQAIGRAYQDLLKYSKSANVAVICPAQFTQEAVKEMSTSDKNGKSHELRTAGGESAEIVRTPDINIALYASIDDLLNNSMRIMSIPSRLCPAFPSFDIYADLGTCMFASLDMGEDE